MLSKTEPYLRIIIILFFVLIGIAANAQSTAQKSMDDLSMDEILAMLADAKQRAIKEGKYKVFVAEEIQQEINTEQKDTTTQQEDVAAQNKVDNPPPSSKDKIEPQNLEIKQPTKVETVKKTGIIISKVKDAEPEPIVEATMETKKDVKPKEPSIVVSSTDKTEQSPLKETSVTQPAKTSSEKFKEDLAKDPTTNPNHDVWEKEDLSKDIISKKDQEFVEERTPINSNLESIAKADAIVIEESTKPRKQVDRVGIVLGDDFSPVKIEKSEKAIITAKVVEKPVKEYEPIIERMVVNAGDNIIEIVDTSTSDDDSDIAIEPMAQVKDVAISAHRVGAKVVINLNLNEPELYEQIMIERSPHENSNYRQIKLLSSTDIQNKDEKYGLLIIDKYPLPIKSNSYYRAIVVSKDGASRVYPAKPLTKGEDTAKL